MAERLDALVPDERGIAFLCECGCKRTVGVSLGDYRVGGAWIDGHKPAKHVNLWVVR
jgi:hypothetical protein